MKTFEIIKKEYTIEWENKTQVGYFIKDSFGIINGPYNSVADAEQDVPTTVDLQYNLDIA